MSQSVWIFAEETMGSIISEMAYGAVVRYSVQGIEFQEMMDREDYEIMELIDDE